MLYAQHRVIDHFIAVCMLIHGFGHHCLDFVSHHAELPAIAPLLMEFSLVIKQVEANAKRMGANADDMFFSKGIGDARFGLIIRTSSVTSFRFRRGCT